jgi:hypothetical protein
MSFCAQDESIRVAYSANFQFILLHSCNYLKPESSPPEVQSLDSNSKSETGLWGQWWEFQPFLHEEKEIVPSVKNEIAC